MNYKEAYDICLKKAKLYRDTISGELPEITGADGKEYKATGTFASRWCWCTSFFTGMSVLAAHTEKDFQALRWANSFFDQYEEKISKIPAATMHDVGFLYLCYSVHLYILTGDVHHRLTALKAADELVRRFDINGRYIEAWSDADSFDKEYRMIIDSMMNTALLFWAWKDSGYTIYYDVAKAHIRTCIDTLVREDYSVAHAWFFNPDGTLKEEANSCGFANGSHWARGTAWIVFGLATAYAYTKDEEYYELAVKIADKFLENLTEDDYIPVWDFRLPEDLPARKMRREDAEPTWDESKPENKIYNRDSSAAAIISCGFMILNEAKATPHLMEAADKMLKSLCDSYLDTDVTTQGMLKKGNGIDKFVIYGDYYFMLAMAMKNYGFDMWNCN